MNDDDLDARIRATMATVVADAPPAPELPAGVTARPGTITNIDRGRRSRWMWPAVAVGVAAATVVAVVLVTRNHDQSHHIVPATDVPTTVPTTESPSEAS